ncbi:MAG: hypothetical protein AB7U73_16155 [Pirellulales bacterium]
MSARSALEFLCEKYRHRKFASDAIDWAVAELIAGSDSESLRRLAATVRPSDWWEVEPLLHASFAELGYRWLDEDDCYWACAEAAARDIVEDRISPSEGCARMYELADALGFPGELTAWCKWEVLLDPNESMNLLSKPAQELTAMVKSDASAWLQTRSRASE